MRVNRMKLLRGALGIVLGFAMGAFVSAQDYGTLQGTSGRTGSNAGPVYNNSGRSFLTWYKELQTDQTGRELIRDNNTTEKNLTGTWTTPALADEAAGAFFAAPVVPLTDPVNVAENLLRGIIASSSAAPAYSYSMTIPSGAGSLHPLGKNFAADTLSIFEWVVEPPAVVPNQRFARTYALSVSLPIGPTGDGLGGLIYPQRYFVYEVVDSLGVSSVDIVDTYYAGFGFVRLGNGGLPTNRLYYYDGVNPIRVRLYNTVPRLGGHENDVVASPAYNWPTTYRSVPYTTCVYADAVKADPTNGEYTASPIVTALDPSVLGSPIREFDARNEYSTAVVNNEAVTLSNGTLNARDYATGTNVWAFSPIADSQYTTNVDSPSSQVTSALPWAVPGTLIPTYRGADYMTAPITNTLGTESAMTVTPNLADGSYQIWVWCPGTRAGETLAQHVIYRVEEAGQAPVDVELDQDAARGWVQLGGNRRWSHLESDPLVVQVTNYSADLGDAGKLAYGDAVRFVGAANLKITSTPVHAVATVRTTNGGPAVATPVVVCAAEDGHIYCLDAAGNGDGTTNIYWAYPSIADPDNASWTDPNQVAGLDGPGGIAEMPQGFDMSSALIQNVSGKDYLYIAARNGRIYCIDMEGRGDMDLARRVPGTTTRVWTYPDDYPAGSRSSRLGAFTGSVVYGDTTLGPTIFVGAPQGRLYALDAVGNANKTTNVRWAYPNLNTATLGEITMTPLYKNNRVYFGTGIKTLDDRGRFFCLDDTGAVQWEFNGTGSWLADSFIAGPAFGDSANMAAGVGDTIFVANENRHIVALRASDGLLQWDTDELGAGVQSNLSTSFQNVFTGVLGATADAFCVLVPTTDGRFRSLFANPGVGFGATNRFGFKTAWGYDAAAVPLLAGMAAGRGFVYGADQAGYVYAFNQLGNGAGGDISGPGAPAIVANDASNAFIEAFRNAKIKFVNRATYEALRLPSGDASLPTFTQATSAANEVTSTAFDWGQTLYMLVYDFPYQDTYAQGALAGQPAPPPVVNYLMSVEGSFQRNISSESRRFQGNTNPTNPGNEGYAIFPYVIQGGGSNALPPGSGKVSFTISSTALTDPPRNVNIDGFFSAPGPITRLFRIANPLALDMKGNGNDIYRLGYTYDPNALENADNGSKELTGTGKLESHMTLDVGMQSHNQTGTQTMSVTDRSLMALILPPGEGLSGVRIQRNDLAWQGGKGAVVNPIDSIPYYAAFFGTGKDLEDYPTTFPNTSESYSDIASERISIVKDPNGDAENPIFSSVGLNPVTDIDDSVDPITRILHPTPFQFSVAFPRFTPANLSRGWLDSNSTAVDSGYLGHMVAFVDSNGDGLYSGGRGRREAFRGFFLSTGVAVDEALSVLQPTIDFGSLADGTGYDPQAPGTGSFSPWTGPYTSLFKPITIKNEGNVNLLHIRLAKAFGNGVTAQPWAIYSSTQDGQAWINGVLNLHATFDSTFQLVGADPILPKANVGDLSPTQFRDNPRVRTNANLGIVSQPLLAGPDPDQPQIAMTVPLGMPAAVYQWIIRVINDQGGDESNLTDANGTSLEASAELEVKARVREQRTTTSLSGNTAPFVDNLIVTNAENFFHGNYQPTGYRSRLGHLIMAFTSDRFSAPGAPGFDKPLPAANVNEKQHRIYISSVRGVTPTSLPNSNINAASPLNDLNRFVPQPTRWANHDMAEYPTTPTATLFPGDPVVAGTDDFGGPALPSFGDINPFSGVAHSFGYMAFIGNAQKQGTNQRYVDSRLMVGRYQTNTITGEVTIDDPVVMPNDTQDVKGRPAILQAGRSALILYPSMGTGSTKLMSVIFDGTNFNNNNPLDLGSGFESVGSPSLSGRVYHGVTVAGGSSNNNPIIDFSFVGKLSGRPAPEVYIGRMTVNQVFTQFRTAYLTPLTFERLEAENEVGHYRARGIIWNPNTPIALYYSLNGSVTSAVNIEVANTRVQDRQTGVISFTTTLGGKAFLNPATGSIRLSNTIPNRSGALFLSYQPRLLRVSSTGGQYTSSQIMFDSRLNPNNIYFFDNTNNAVAPSKVERPYRTALVYGRSAGGNQTTRPYSQTLRFGVQLPTAILTLPSGDIAGLTVAGATGDYQVDPANGRIYFSDTDENRTVQIAYTGVDDTTGGPITFGSTAYQVTYVTEHAEEPVPIDQAVNEGEAWFSLDPFEVANNSNRRPGLWWLFWTSTRTGPSDIYYETLAPKFTPNPRR